MGEYTPDKILQIMSEIWPDIFKYDENNFRQSSFKDSLNFYMFLPLIVNETINKNKYIEQAQYTQTRGH